MFFATVCALLSLSNLNSRCFSLCLRFVETQKELDLLLKLNVVQHGALNVSVVVSLQRPVFQVSLRSYYITFFFFSSLQMNR